MSAAATGSKLALMRTVFLLLSAVSLSFAAASDPGLPRLEQQINYVSQVTDGAVGVSAIHLETRRSVSIRGSDPFPMASTFKVPVAVQIMTLVDEGKLRLSDMVSLTPQDLHPGSGELSDLLFHPGLSLSIENLLEIMLVISDNSAADIMLRQAGGPAAVTARMRALGFNNIRIDRPTALLISDWVGVKNVPPQSEWNRDMWRELYSAIPKDVHQHAAELEIADPRDTATPDDMTKLLAGLWNKSFLKPASANTLLDVMHRCQTGKGRIPAMLPAGTDVAHKTGSLGGVADDVGIVTLPFNAGHVAISVFVRSSTKPELAEKAIAEIARTIYDYFTLFPVAQQQNVQP
jgi:beta-lactamase class A